MKCWPWTHHWKVWEETERGEMVQRHDPETKAAHDVPIRLGHYLVQQRDCLLCGKRQLRTETTR